MSELAEFRAEVRAWVEENCPPGARGPGEIHGGGSKQQIRNPDVSLWLERCAERGYTAPTWPRQYGGAGLDREQARALAEAMRDARARPPLTGMGLSMIGPTLLEFGTEAQRAEHLPKITSGELRWCQGYSEPGAGSDLASLKTRADDAGDHFVINGQKIWTSGANFADWIFCLVRTDFDAPKHEGISFVLFSMDQPGVTVRPILLISGYSPFCETFFDNAIAHKSNLVGELNKGWTIAKRLLQYERESIASLGGRRSATRSATLAEQVMQYAGDDGRISDPALRASTASQTMDAQAMELTIRRSAEQASAGTGPGATSSMFKYYGTELNKRRYEVLLQAMGTRAMGWEGPGFERDELNVTREWLRSKANSIEGGTSEVQLNIIAKRVLGLPD